MSFNVRYQRIRAATQRRVEQLATLASVRFKRKYHSRITWNFVEGYANRITHGDPTFQEFRDKWFGPIALLISKAGITPNLISLMGLIAAIFAAIFVDYPAVFAGFLFLNLVCDGIDGVVARRLNMECDFGSIVDVTCDTLSMLVVAAGLYIFGHISFEIFCAYSFVVTIYTFRSALKSRAIVRIYRSIGSRFFAFIGLAIIFLTHISGNAGNVINSSYLFVLIISLLGGAYFIDVFSSALKNRRIVNDKEYFS